MNPAFAYLYDETLSDHKYERELALVETELARRGIDGRIVRLTMFREPRDIIVDLAHGHLRNIIIVGHDQTLERMMWFLPELNLTVGFLPMSVSIYAPLLDIPLGADGVDVLAARFIDMLDVGMINNRTFFTEVIIPEGNAQLKVNKKYTISPEMDGAIAIRNLAGATTQNGPCANPSDGWLEGVIQSEVGREGFLRKKIISESRVFFKDGCLISEQAMTIFVDGEPIKGTTFDLSISSHKLTMITGHKRAWLAI